MGSLPYPNTQFVFQQQFESVRRDEVVGVLLAFFLGCFGIHHFYLGRVGLGILYICFSWTGIPALLGVIECFFMPGRVRMYNAMQAAGLAAAMGIGVPGWVGYPGWAAPGWAPAAYPTSYAAYPGEYAANPRFGMMPAEQGTSIVSTESSLYACSRCGQANPAGTRFCPNCGSRLA